MQENTEKKSFHSRFGYIMVAAGAAIGLGNVWKFPYLAYKNGGGAFILIYILICFFLAHPLVEVETAIGRHSKSNAIDAYGNIHKKWKFIGVINVICTVLIDMYYIVVSGYVLKYAVMYFTGANFGNDVAQFYNDFISNPWKPILYAGILMVIIVFFLSFGITKIVEKINKIIMPLLLVILLVCGIWALFAFDGAIEGLKFYFIPDFTNFTWKSFADAAMQSMFSVGFGWAIFTTLGANVKDSANIKKDSAMVTAFDTLVAIIAGLVVIPSVVGSGSNMVAGPSLIFIALPQIFAKIPGGTILGAFFFISIIFAVVSSYFTFLEIPVKCVEEKCKISHKKATIFTAIFIFCGAILCALSQGNGVLSWIKMPWIDASAGVIFYNIYDWVDCLSGYILLPLGCLFTAFFCVKIWGFKEYELELTQNGRDGRLNLFSKIDIGIIIPILTIIVVLNCFGIIS